MSSPLTLGEVLHVSTREEYDEIFASAERDGRLILVDCYAEWCPPCQAMKPVFAAMARQYRDVVFLSIDVEQFSPPNIQIWAMPTFVFFLGGSKVSTVVGAKESALHQGLRNNGQVSVCSKCTIS